MEVFVLRDRAGNEADANVRHLRIEPENVRDCIRVPLSARLEPRFCNDGSVLGEGVSRPDARGNFTAYNAPVDPIKSRNAKITNRLRSTCGGAFSDRNGIPPLLISFRGGAMEGRKPPISLNQLCAEPQSLSRIISNFDLRKSSQTRRHHRQPRLTQFLVYEGNSVQTEYQPRGQECLPRK